MKKFLISTIVAALVATLMGVFVACGDKDNGKSDADIAKEAISTVSQITNSSVPASENTDTTYTVMGQVKVDGKAYTVKWTVSSDFTDYGNYITVGKMDATTKKVTIGITKAQGQEISYTLKATVTVGKTSKSAEFNRKVSAGLAGEGQNEATISFADKTNRVSQTTAQQVWEQSGVKFTNDKGAGNDIADSSNPVRLYKGSIIKIEYAGISKLVFHSSDADSYNNYTNNLKGSLEATGFGSVTVDGNDVTLELASPMDIVEFTASVGQCRVYSIDVIANNNVTDADKVAGAKTALDLAVKNYTATGTYDLPAEKNGATVTWAVTSDYAEIDNNGKLKITSMPATKTDLTLTATITVNDASDTKEITVALVPLNLENDGTSAKPYKPSEAVMVTKLLAEGANSASDVYVKGYVIKCTPYTQNDEVKSYNIYIADEYVAGKDTDGEDVFYLYGVKLGNYLTKDGLNNGDLATFKGQLQYYKSSSDGTLTPELATGGECVAVTAGTRTDADIVADAKKAVDLTKKTYSKSGEEVTLPTTLQSATLEWAVKNAPSEYVAIENGKLKINSIPETATNVTLVVTIKSNAVQDTKEITISVEPLQLTGKGTQASPFTMADVKKIGDTLDNNARYGGTTPTQVYVTGYIVKVGSWSGGNYNNFTGCYLIDEYDETKTEKSEGAIQLYRLGSDGVYVTGEDSIAKGDLITVKGWIQVYNNKVQITNDGNNSNNPLAVDLIKAGKSDTEIVADAKENVTLAPSYNAGTYNLSTTSGGAQLTWTVKTGADVTISNDGDSMTIAEPSAQHTVTLTVTIKKGSVEETKDITFTVLVTTTKGTEADPYTVAELNDIFSTLTNGQTYKVGGVDKLVYVRGYVVDAGSDGTYGRQNVKIADSATADASTGLVIYGHNYDADLPKNSNLEVGDRVLVCGYLKIFNETKEIADSATRPVIKIEQKVELTDEQKAQKALNAVKDTLTVKAAGNIDLTASTVEGVTLAWSTADTTYTVTGNTTDGYKLNVAALPATEATVTLTVTATYGEATKTKTVTVTVQSGNSAPTLTLTKESIAALTSGSGYAVYNGEHTVTVDGTDYKVTTNQIMPNVSSGEDVMQWQASASYLTVTGKFSKIVIVLVSTSAYTANANNITAYAGDTALTVKHDAGDDTTNSSGAKLYTIEIEVTGDSEQTIKIAHEKSGACYMVSMEFTIAE